MYTMGVEHTIGCHMKISKKVVRKSLCKVGTIKLESHEHNACPERDIPVNFPNKPQLLAPSPSETGIESVNIFPEKLQISN